MWGSKGAAAKATDVSEQPSTNSALVVPWLVLGESVSSDNTTTAVCTTSVPCVTSLLCYHRTNASPIRQPRHSYVLCVRVDHQDWEAR